MKYLLRLYLVVLFVFLFLSCSSQIGKQAELEKSFAKGAGLSWLSEMEASGVRFFNGKNKPGECMAILRDMGLNSVRLRVWIDPEKGWRNEADFLAKSMRAKELGLRVMLDFHYSDSRFDLEKQNKSAVCDQFDFEGLTTVIRDHTESVLIRLKQNHIEPEWIQIGNEMGDAMSWVDGWVSTHMKNYALLNRIEYDVVKSVFPDTKVIVHLQNGYDKVLFSLFFEALKSNGGKWDVIGMSVYPNSDNWKSLNNQCVANARELIEKHQCEIMICEVGMPWNEADQSYLFLSDLKSKLLALNSKKCLGVFYCEPQAFGEWNGYTMGAFDRSGKPTVALHGLFGK